MIVYLALGSNIGDRLGNIQMAIKLLTEYKEIKLLSASSFYETEPVDIVSSQETEWFINVAVAIETSLPPETLLEKCLEVERNIGRHRKNPQVCEPREIDIDILIYESLIYQTETLCIPHPRMHERAFVLVPLLEINPRLIHPILHQTIEELHEAIPAPEEVLLFGTRIA